jgi:hypothetical protein
MVEMKRITTDGVLLTGHKGAAVEVPFDPADEWGVREEALWPGRNGHPVEVALNGVRFRSAIVSRMSRFYVLVDEALARRAGAAVGDQVKLTVWPVSALPSPASAAPVVRTASAPASKAPPKRRARAAKR